MSQNPNDKTHDPTIYSPEAIEMLLDGSRRQIDGLLLRGLNDLAKAFIAFRDSEFRPHIGEEMEMHKALGSPTDVERRRVWLDLQIDKEQRMAELRSKILQSTLTKYLPTIIVLVFLAAVTGVAERAYDLWAYWKDHPVKELKK